MHARAGTPRATQQAQRSCAREVAECKTLMYLGNFLYHSVRVCIVWCLRELPNSTTQEEDEIWKM